MFSCLRFCETLIMLLFHQSNFFQHCTACCQIKMHLLIQNSQHVKYSRHYRLEPSVKHFQHSTAGTVCVFLSFCSALEAPSPITALHVHGYYVSQPFQHSLRENCNKDSSVDTHGCFSFFYDSYYKPSAME